MKSIILRDIRLALRAGGGLGQALGFFVIFVVLVPFGIGDDQALNARLAPGLLWIGALLSALLTLERIFYADWQDGSLEVIMTSSLPLEAYVLGKMIVHWAMVMMPLVALAPVLAVLLNLEAGAYGMMLLSLFLGAPALSAIGVFAAGLTVSIQRGGLLLSLLVLPLYIPTLMFGATSVRRAAMGFEMSSSLMILAAISLASLAVLPFVTAASLRAIMR